MILKTLIRIKSLAIVLLLISGSWSCLAQQKTGKAYLDSLLTEESRMTSDSVAVKLLVDISFEYSTSNPTEGIRYGHRALELSQKIGWKKGEALACNNIGANYLNKGAYPQAMDYFFRALRIHEDLGDTFFSGKVESNIGNAYYSHQDFSKALEHYLKSLNAARATGDKNGEFTTAGNIGNAYLAQNNYDKALSYLREALAIADSLGDKRGVINQLTNIGTVYSAMHDKQAALENYSKALHMAEQEGDRQTIAANEGNIGEIYFEIAKDTISKHAPAAKATSLRNAVAYLQKGIADARSIHFSQAVIEFLDTLSAAYSLQGNYERALRAHLESATLKDSTFNIENSALIAGLETKRAVELKDKDILIARLRKRNERILFIVGLVVLFLIAGILLRSFRRQKRSNALLSAEKKRSDDLLLNILPEEVAEELKDRGKAQARRYDDVSVLFTDFVNFTGTAEMMGPEALVQELHECFSVFDAIIERKGLEKIKTIGDAYMAACGLPVSNPLHARNTVEAALEILEFVEQRRANGSAFEIRIGISSGPVVAGIVGIRKFAYDIWGDTVNTAARMEQYSEPGAINISQNTFELVKQYFHCTYRGKIAAKHKGAVEMYFLTLRDTEKISGDASNSSM